MSKHRWFIEQKRQHVAAWRAIGLTRQQLPLPGFTFSA